MGAIASKSPRFYALLLAGFLLLIAILGWRAASKMIGMSSTPSVSASELQGAKPGDTIKVVMEIQQTEGKKVEGKTLERKDDTHYRRTANAISASFDQHTKIVMGGAGDIHPDAVVHVSGKWAADQSLRAEQIVILTGYVKVE